MRRDLEPRPVVRQAAAAGMANDHGRDAGRGRAQPRPDPTAALRPRLRLQRLHQGAALSHGPQTESSVQRRRVRAAPERSCLPPEDTVRQTPPARGSAAAAELWERSPGHGRVPDTRGTAGLGRLLQRASDRGGRSGPPDSCGGCDSGAQGRSLAVVQFDGGLMEFPAGRSVP